MEFRTIDTCAPAWSPDPDAAAELLPALESLPLCVLELSTCLQQERDLDVSRDLTETLG
jgi:hypothetical protein